jgi:hypothetical protein
MFFMIYEDAYHSFSREPTGSQPNARICPFWAGDSSAILQSHPRPIAARSMGVCVSLKRCFIESALLGSSQNDRDNVAPAGGSTWRASYLPHNRAQLPYRALNDGNASRGRISQRRLPLAPANRNFKNSRGRSFEERGGGGACFYSLGASARTLLAAIHRVSTCTPFAQIGARHYCLHTFCTTHLPCTEFAHVFFPNDAHKLNYYLENKGYCQYIDKQ